MTEPDIRTWALRGAEQRLLEIAEEASRIYAAFPELRDRQSAATTVGTATRRGRARRAAAAPQGAAPARRGARKRRQVTLSPEAKERIAAAQRKRWAEWRAKKGAASEGVGRKGRAAKKR